MFLWLLLQKNKVFALLLFYCVVQCPELSSTNRQDRRSERLITDRALKPGSQLPTETDLATELYVSRTTIRNA